MILIYYCCLAFSALGMAGDIGPRFLSAQGESRIGVVDTYLIYEMYMRYALKWPWCVQFKCLRRDQSGW